MRFYVPEWDDAVDGAYDFVHDEHSELDRSVRSLQYIWDIFEYESTPIDGVLISREKIEESEAKFERYTDTGVYDDPVLDIPEWLPTISDCGAWGYKSLPFPPYDAADMLQFYENLNVDIGVTIDHLVLGSGKDGRLYLNEHALGDEVTKSNLPEKLTDSVDVMTDEWPGEDRKWPDYVVEEEPSIHNVGPVSQFEQADFEGDVSTILTRLTDDPRAVYRENDTQYRYNLTLRNAEEMKHLYDQGDYPFRLMVAYQGWDPESYARATQSVLDMGYDYLGIGGVAGSGKESVRDIVTEVGNVIKRFEEEQTTRVDCHVFGFAKTDVFESIGRSGMTSFDSASMLRSAWEGGNNYHTEESKYAAIRVRFGLGRDANDVAIEKALRGQELLRSLRAFDEGESIGDAIEEWQAAADTALSGLIDYIETVRQQGTYEDFKRLRDAKEHFREDYKHGRVLTASFSRKFRTRIVKLLRADTPDNPNAHHDYLEPIAVARDVFNQTFPNTLDTIRELEADSGTLGTRRQILTVVRNYTHSDVIGDEGHFPDYRTLLGDRPWDDCECNICEDHGIEVAIFRGNNRNRRRGFHNTKQFYDQFKQELPKLLVAAPLTEGETTSSTVEEYLAAEFPAFWEQTHDLPVAEIGVIDQHAFTEWWDTRGAGTKTDWVSSLDEQAKRFQEAFVFDPEDELDDTVLDDLRAGGCSVTVSQDPAEMRTTVLDRLNYEDSFLPNRHIQTGIADW